jgi:hypothetical protein
MAAGNRWRFIQLGLLLSGLGAHADTSDCDELPPILPEAPAEAASAYEYGTRYLNCGATAADGTGAVVASSTRYSYNPVTLQGWSHGDNGWVMPLWMDFWTDIFEPYGQPRGFLSFSLSNSFYVSYLDSQTWQFTHHPREPHELVRVTEDPRGGMRALFSDGSLKAYGPTGETLWSTPLTLSATVQALGVDMQGHTLVLTSPTQGLWVDASGQPGTPFSTMAPLYDWDSPYKIVPQATQGLFVGVPNGGTTTWTAFSPLDPQPRPAPAWLSGDPDRPLVRLPSGKGYLRWGRPAVCQHEAEILSASGKSCGKTRFPALPPDRLGYCGSMSLGRDGTVIETLPRDSLIEEHEGQYSEIPFCRVRWWPALFKP